MLCGMLSVQVPTPVMLVLVGMIVYGPSYALVRTFPKKKSSSDS